MTAAPHMIDEGIVTAPFTPEQEVRVREIVAEMIGQYGRDANRVLDARLGQERENRQRDQSFGYRRFMAGL